MSIIHTAYTDKQCEYIDIGSVDMAYENRLLLRVGNNLISMTSTVENFCNVFSSAPQVKKHPRNLMNRLNKFHLSGLIMMVETKWSVWAIFTLT